MTDDIDRRRLLAGLGATATTVCLAGCTGGGGDGGGGSGSDGGDGGGGGGGDGGSSSDGDVDSGGDADVDAEARQRVEEFVGPAENFDGTIVDATGEDAVSVDVGAEGNGGNFAFAPPAVAVSSGTAVTWTWTGEGGQHNVVAKDDSDFSFDSGTPKIEGSFEQSFDGTGVALYYCEPHRTLNMKGAVVVVE